jgi:hypothetical protein
VLVELSYFDEVGVGVVGVVVVVAVVVVAVAVMCVGGWWWCRLPLENAHRTNGILLPRYSDEKRDVRSQLGVCFLAPLVQFT